MHYRVAVLVFRGILLQAHSARAQISGDVLQSLFFVEPFCKFYTVKTAPKLAGLQSLFFVEPFCKEHRSKETLQDLQVAVLVFRGTLLQEPNFLADWKSGANYLHLLAIFIRGTGGSYPNSIILSN